MEDKTRKANEHKGVLTHLQDVRSTMQDAMLQDATAVEAGSLELLTGCEC